MDKTPNGKLAINRKLRLMGTANRRLCAAVLTQNF